MPSNTRPTRWNTSCITAADRIFRTRDLRERAPSGALFCLHLLPAGRRGAPTGGAAETRARNTGARNTAGIGRSRLNADRGLGARGATSLATVTRYRDGGRAWPPDRKERPRKRRVARPESRSDGVSRTRPMERSRACRDQTPRGVNREPSGSDPIPARLPPGRPRRTPVIPPHAKGARPAGRAPLQFRKLRADQSRPISRQTAGTASAASASFSASPSRKGVTPQARIGWSQP